MGLFSKKPEPGLQVFENYADAMGPWLQRVQDARASGARLTSLAEAVDIAGDLPPLALSGLNGTVQRDRATYATRAWLNSHADRLSRQDVLQGRDPEFWQNLADAIWSVVEVGMQKPR